jgi:hypothetical protein
MRTETTRKWIYKKLKGRSKIEGSNVVNPGSSKKM